MFKVPLTPKPFFALWQNVNDLEIIKTKIKKIHEVHPCIFLRRFFASGHKSPKKKEPYERPIPFPVYPPCYCNQPQHIILAFSTFRITPLSLYISSSSVKQCFPGRRHRPQWDPFSSIHGHEPKWRQFYELWKFTENREKVLWLKFSAKMIKNKKSFISI